MGAILNFTATPAQVYVRVEITDEDRRRAAARAPDRVTTAAANRFGSEVGRIAIGYLGEEIVARWLGVPIADDPEYDMIYNGMKVEVKTIGPCKFRPPPDFLATVNSPLPEGMRPQTASIYVFTRVHDSYEKAWLVGWARCATFFLRGTYYPKGSTVAGVNLKKANATVLPIYELNPMTALKGE